MKIHVTDPRARKVYLLDVADDLCYGKKINSVIDLAGLSLPEGFPGTSIVVRGMSGKDGAPTRHDVSGVIARKLWSKTKKRRIRYHPNNVTEEIKVIDAVTTTEIKENEGS